MCAESHYYSTSMRAWKLSKSSKAEMGGPLFQFDQTWIEMAQCVPLFPASFLAVNALACLGCLGQVVILK